MVYLSIILPNSHCPEYLVGFTVRHESRRVLHGDTSPGCPFRCHRLDDLSHCHKRKAQWHKSYIGPVGALLCHFSNSLSHSVVRICVPRCFMHRRSHSTIGIFAFGNITGASGLYLDVIPMLTSAPRGYYSACYPLHVNLPSVLVLYLSADRWFIIAFTTICVSHSLSLYRDIHKLFIASIFTLCGCS